MLSHKYGQRFLHSIIEENEFNAIKNEINKNNNIDISLNYKSGSVKLQVNDLLEYCYKLDENEIPKCYKLLNINQIIQGYSLQVFPASFFVKVLILFVFFK